jgi:hypothetical protein
LNVNPYERDVHEAVADALDKMLLKPAFWFPYPAGVTQLSPQQHARYSRFGLKRGLPDIWILYDGVWLIELKRRGGQLSKTRTVSTKRGTLRVLEGQVDVFPKLCASGAVRDIAVCYTVDDVLDQIERWKIPILRRVFSGVAS